ncbi:membrane protein [Sodiomyces alkalinus F11]|uniref:Membrane protein n=1 Tax=Sodiomyces alkalinus (strain CBS 110278 / VKM F-3762 / F11) TaxID=1314773 RepID=A0A3N2PM62_SODAK|nr:membrane protein [Sodiomyces alkalinus F11]ROT35615.1 membrane protein [Sodiomyces alkalinus F11]
MTSTAARNEDVQDPPDETPTPQPNSGPETKDADTPSKQGLLGLVLAVMTWTPRRLRYDPGDPPEFGYGLNMLYALAATISVANLYYNQPVLNRIAETFDVSFERASSVATLMQAGYAAGLLFICPLGDMLRRRPFVLGLIWITSMLWLGLCVTDSFAAFSALSFICGATTVTPQLMLPLVGDIAPPRRKGTALSIVVSGLMLGMLVARLLSGIVASFTDWRNIYWFSFGAQWLLAALLFVFMPDYPSANPDGLNYFRALWTIVTILVQEPVLVQACLIVFLCSAVFTSYWTTLSFLLSSPPYEYGSLVIGLFSLIGVVGIVGGPLYGRFVVDRFVSTFASLVGQVLTLVGVVIGTWTGETTVAGPIIQAVFGDTGIQMSQIANRAAIYSIDAKASNRVNTAYMVSAFCGQLTGTAVGNRLYAAGGWTWSGSASIGFVALSVVVGFARGPREQRWIGWRGGWRLRRDDDVHAKPSTSMPQDQDETIHGQDDKTLVA